VSVFGSQQGRNCARRLATLLFLHSSIVNALLQQGEISICRSSQELRQTLPVFDCNVSRSILPRRYNHYGVTWTSYVGGLAT
jgi:hypothetical protein